MTDKAKELGEESVSGFAAVGESYVGGLFKREYFAGLAMQRLVYIVPGEGNDVTASSPEITAKLALKYADALLEELSKEQI